MRERSDKRTQKVAQVAVCCRFEHHAVFIRCQHQCCPHYCLGQGTGATLAIVSSSARCLYSNEFSPALTPSSVHMTCLCACHCILSCVYVLKPRNTLWLGSMTNQIVWYNSKWSSWGIQRKKSTSQCVCVPMPEWNCVCSYIYTFCMWSHCFDILFCPDLRMTTASGSSWGGSPMVHEFLTRNTCL